MFDLAWRDENQDLERKLYRTIYESIQNGVDVEKNT